MILEISEDLEELLEKIQATSDLLKDLAPSSRLLVLGVALSRAIKNLDEDVDEGEMVALLMEKAEQVISALEELQIEDMTPKPTIWS